MTATAKTDPLLDADELLHLAIIDSQAGRHDVAIAKLKVAVAQAPKHAKAHYLLAAEHAQIGLYDRAVEGMNKALSLDAELDTARLQLGLLHYTQGRIPEATAAWAGLDKLGPDDALFLFKSALLKLQAGDLATAVPLLERAVQNVRGNAALLNDIQRVLQNVRERAAPAAATPQASQRLATKYGDSTNDER